MNLQNNWDSFFPILATFLIDRFLATFDQRRVAWRQRQRRRRRRRERLHRFLASFFALLFLKHDIASSFWLDCMR